MAKAKQLEFSYVYAEDSLQIMRDYVMQFLDQIAEQRGAEEKLKPADLRKKLDLDVSFVEGVHSQFDGVLYSSETLTEQELQMFGSKLYRLFNTDIQVGRVNLTPYTEQVVIEEAEQVEEVGESIIDESFADIKEYVIHSISSLLENITSAEDEKSDGAPRKNLTVFLEELQSAIDELN